ncbi:MAG TPA: hypothetical protein PK461_14500, partial [Alcaligenes faecalis]|nr:hypothetical protein [Alcaligenes faecalis]
ALFFDCSIMGDEMLNRRKVFAAIGAAFFISAVSRSRNAIADSVVNSNEKALHNPKRNYFFAFAGNETVVGAANIGIGEVALSKISTGFNNVAVGDQAMRIHADGINNVAVGALAMTNSESCIDCTAVGTGALQSAINGVGATAMGRLSCNSLLSAGNNTGYGDSTLRFLQVGDSNVAIGYRSAETLEDGSGNVSVGAHAAKSVGRGDRNIFIGYKSGSIGGQTENVSNSIAIGANTRTTKNNQIVIGTTDTEEIVIGGVRVTPRKLRRLLALIDA